MTGETEVCVTEMGMRGLGQINQLCSIASPTMGIVTNVGTSHIGILGSQENIALAKSELIRNLSEDGTAILMAMILLCAAWEPSAITLFTMDWGKHAA